MLSCAVFLRVDRGFGLSSDVDSHCDTFGLFRRCERGTLSSLSLPEDNTIGLSNVSGSFAPVDDIGLSDFLGWPFEQLFQEKPHFWRLFNAEAEERISLSYLRKKSWSSIRTKYLTMALMAILPLILMLLHNPHC